MQIETKKPYYIDRKIKVIPLSISRSCLQSPLKQLKKNHHTTNSAGMESINKQIQINQNIGQYIRSKLKSITKQTQIKNNKYQKLIHEKNNKLRQQHKIIINKKLQELNKLKRQIYLKYKHICLGKQNCKNCYQIQRQYQKIVKNIYQQQNIIQLNKQLTKQSIDKRNNQQDKYHDLCEIQNPIHQTSSNLLNQSIIKGRLSVPMSYDRLPKQLKQKEKYNKRYSIKPNLQNILLGFNFSEKKTSLYKNQNININKQQQINKKTQDINKSESYTYLEPIQITKNKDKQQNIYLYQKKKYLSNKKDSKIHSNNNQNYQKKINQKNQQYKFAMKMIHKITQNNSHRVNLKNKMSQIDIEINDDDQSLLQNQNTQVYQRQQFNSIRISNIRKPIKKKTNFLQYNIQSSGKGLKRITKKQLPQTEQYIQKQFRKSRPKIRKGVIKKILQNLYGTIDKSQSIDLRSQDIIKQQQQLQNSNHEIQQNIKEQFQRSPRSTNKRKGTKYHQEKVMYEIFKKQRKNNPNNLKRNSVPHFYKPIQMRDLVNGTFRKITTKQSRFKQLKLANHQPSILGQIIKPLQVRNLNKKTKTIINLQELKKQLQLYFQNNSFEEYIQNNYNFYKYMQTNLLNFRQKYKKIHQQLHQNWEDQNNDIVDFIRNLQVDHTENYETINLKPLDNDKYFSIEYYHEQNKNKGKKQIITQKLNKQIISQILIQIDCDQDRQLYL